MEQASHIMLQEYERNYPTDREDDVQWASKRLVPKNVRACEEPHEKEQWEYTGFDLEIEVF